MGAGGFEPPRESQQKTPASVSGGSKSGNIRADSGPATPPAKPTPPTDPELAAVVRAWPTIPQAVRAGIVAMVRAAGGETRGKLGDRP